METPRAQTFRYDALIEPLIEGLTPVRRLWPVGLRLALWTAFEVLILALVVISYPHAALPALLADPRFALELLLFVLAGVLSAGLALRTAIPGRGATGSELLLASALALAGVLLIPHEPAIGAVTLAAFVAAGVKCLGCTVLLAMLPWLALFWAVRRGAPMRLESAGWLIGLAAFAFAFAASRLGCSIDNSLHVLLWHALPAALGAALSVFAGAAWLKRRGRAAAASPLAH